MDWSYDAWPSGEPYNWGNAGRGHTVWDSMDYHVDLGCGKLKKGRIGIDLRAASGVNIVMDLNTMVVQAVAEEIGADAIPLGASWSQPDGGRTDPVPLTLTKKGLPFEDGSIKSIISHHALEHIGDGFLALIDEVYRVLEPGGIFRPITPLFPSRSAVEDADHRRYFMEGTWDAFCGHLGDENNPTGSWLDSFSVPYTTARFEEMHKDITAQLPPEQMWGPEDSREIRVALKAIK